MHKHTAVASQQTLSAAELLGCATFENSAGLLITRSVQQQGCQPSSCNARMQERLLLQPM
jgi:hypothetical protein